jgi:hypothetical protein
VNTTKDGHNFVFTGGQTPPEGLWLPKKPSPSGKKAKSSKSKPTTLSPTGCPERVEQRGDFVCGFPDKTAWPEAFACRKRPGDVPPEVVEIKEKWKPHATRIKAVQHAKRLELSLTTDHIEEHVLLKQIRPGVRYTWKVERLQFQWLEERSESVTQVERSETSVGGKPSPHLGTYLVDPQDLDNIAKTLRVLLSAGRLKRVIVRGYADDAEAQRGDAVALSERRAQFVADELQRQYRFVLERDDKKAPATHAKGGPPKVCVIGCGSFYAPAGSDAGFRVVELEIEHKEPEPPRKPREFRQVVPIWTLHTYEEPDTAKRIRLLYRYGTTTTGVEEGLVDPEDLEQVREDALGYVDFFEDTCVREELLPSVSLLYDAKHGCAGQLEEIRRWIHGWGGLSTTEGLPSLYPTYWIKVRGVRKTLHDPPIRFLEDASGNVKTIRLKPVEPSHLLVAGTHSTISMGAGKELAERLQTASRIPNHVSLGGLRVRFKEDMPPAGP